MKFFKFILTLTVVLASLTINASTLLSDYSHFRGFCYPSGWRADKAALEKELGYAVCLNLNSARIWLNYGQYQRNPQAFLNQLTLFVRTAHGMGISTMPIFFNGNGLNPDVLKPEFKKEGYAQKALQRIKAVLTDVYKVFENRRATTDDILKAAEWVANLQEGAEMVPMYEPPTAKIQTWRAMPEAKRNADEIRDFAYELAVLLKK